MTNKAGMMADSTEKITFWRVFGTDRFEECLPEAHPEDELIYILHDVVKDERCCRKAGTEGWIPLSEEEYAGLAASGQAVGVYPAPYEGGTDGYRKVVKRLHWHAPGTDGFPETTISSRMRRCHARLNREKRLKACYDGNQFPEALYKVEFCFDWNAHSVIMTSEKAVAQFIDPEETQLQFSLEGESWRFSYGDGTITCLEAEEGSGNSDMPVRLPHNVEAIFVDRMLAMRDSWAGRPLTNNCTFTGLRLVDALIRFPYEPNLAAVLDGSLCRKEVSVDRKNPECYRELCQKLNIQTSRSINRLYLENPQVLMEYVLLTECGFSDVNTIVNILKKTRISSWLSNYYAEDFIFFMKEAIQRRGETAAWHPIEKADLNLILDSLSMFREYRRHISEELVDEIMRDGLTSYCHDALSRLVTAVAESGVTFEYEADVRQYEWDYDGYTFRLAEDSDRLVDVGSKLHNCVAGYVRRVDNRETTVVYAEKDGAYRMCIEILGGEVEQARGPRNAELKGADLDAFLRWKHHCGLR